MGSRLLPLRAPRGTMEAALGPCLRLALFTLLARALSEKELARALPEARLL